MLALEWLVLGRAAYGESVVGGSIIDSWRVKKDGRLIWAESFRITDETFPLLNRKALLSNYKAIATLVYFGPDLEKRLEFLREILCSLGCDCAATLVAGLIVHRTWAGSIRVAEWGNRDSRKNKGQEERIGKLHRRN